MSVLRAPFFKGPRVSEATRRRRKRDALKHLENAHKQLVRDRDVTCRFPLCPCGQFNLFLEVSHREHKGMGGDPTGERSTPERMIYLCNFRHKESAMSIDKGTVAWYPLDELAGANGPIVWQIDLGAFTRDHLARGMWTDLAFELAPGKLAPLTDLQTEMIAFLSAALKDRFR